jgi:uncharacterized RDD family membrane protein YckC
VFASASRRLVAYAIDAALVTTILFIAFIGFGAIVGPVVELRGIDSNWGVSVDIGRTMIALLVSAGISSAYFFLSWALRLATPGQQLLGLRVSRATGEGALTPGQALRRWTLLMGPLYLSAAVGTPIPDLRAPIAIAITIWYAILLSTTVLSPTRRGLHDHWSGSAVLRIGGAGS